VVGQPQAIQIGICGSVKSASRQEIKHWRDARLSGLGAIFGRQLVSEKHKQNAWTQDAAASDVKYRERQSQYEHCGVFLIAGKSYNRRNKNGKNQRKQ
jgi:hypothetical protein